MPHPVEILAEAVVELFEARCWYQQQEHDSGVLFSNAVDAAITAIAQSPERWAVFRKTARRFVLRQFPVSVVYVFRDQKSKSSPLLMPVDGPIIGKSEFRSMLQISSSNGKH